METRRLAPSDRDLARNLFVVMAEVFGEAHEPLSDSYLERLLSREDFWAIAAFVGDEVAGGLTAHTLPMTRLEGAELSIYDVAVRPEYQRQGVGRKLLGTLRAGAEEAGLGDVFVGADNDDRHALEFYRAQGGAASPVTIFTFSPRERVAERA